MIYSTHSEKETIEAATDFVKNVQFPGVLCLYGDLGMGKSVFARALIRALCEDQSLEVPSPTFTLVQEYDAPAGPVYHLDLYRLGVPEEIYELGWDDALHDGFVIVEWPERLEALLPRARIDVMIKAGTDGPDSRVLEIKSEPPEN